MTPVRKMKVQKKCIWHLKMRNRVLARLQKKSAKLNKGERNLVRGATERLKANITKGQNLVNLLIGFGGLVTGPCRRSIRKRKDLPFTMSPGALSPQASHVSPIVLCAIFRTVP